jgi:hypothetical protein
MSYFLPTNPNIMKSILRITTVLMFIISFSAKAQEIIIKRTGEQIKVVVTEVNPDDIKYKDWSNQSGGVLTILKSQVHKIKYADGTEDFIGNLTGKLQPLKPEPTQTKTAQTPNTTESKKKTSTTIPKKEPVKVVEARKTENRDSDTGLFTILGVNYMLPTLKDAPSGVGLNLGIGYRFHPSIGVMAAVEPNYLLYKNIPSGVDIGVNIMGGAYGAVVYKVVSRIYVYGGAGEIAVYSSKAVAPLKSLNGEVGYSGGLMFDVTKVIGIKAGYNNYFKGGTSDTAFITVGVIKSLNW